MPDGTILARYAYTQKLSRSRWAWEFLRRNRTFLEDARRYSARGIPRQSACRNVTLLRPGTGQTAAERWGLLCFPDPDADGLSADVFWNPAIYAGALKVHVGPRSPGEPCEIFEETTRLCDVLHLADAAGREHVLLRAGDLSVQVACEGLSLLSPEPVRIQIVIAGVACLGTHLRYLEKARALLGAPVPRRWTRTTRALRHALMALDCRQAGLSQKDTARLIYGRARADSDWGAPGGAMRGEIRRAIRKGFHYAAGGYSELLDAPEGLDLHTCP